MKSNLDKIVESVVKSVLKEMQEFQNNDNYSHFAVNKATNKIVNGWDYSDYEPEELRMYKKDYFMVDLEDNGLDPKNYTILTFNGCKKRGIDPNNNADWANE